MFIPNTSDAPWSQGVLLRQHIALHQHHWLFDPLSLTDKLVACSAGDFNVVVLQQQICRPLFSEARKLGLSHARQAFVREVALVGNGVPWVYARTVIPLASLGGELKSLRYLGNRSLGSALFADPTMQRGELQIAKINTAYLPSLSIFCDSEPTWGRRSVFNLKNKSLLVTEVFLKRLWNNEPQARNVSPLNC